MKIKSALLAAVAAVAMLASLDAFAATADSTFAVTARVNKTCTIATTAIDFGDYTGAAVPMNSTLTLACSKGTSFDVTLSTGGGGSYTPRQMSGTGANLDKLNYNLFFDSGLTQIWGDGSGTTVTFSDVTSDKASHDFTIYGSVTAGQDVNWDTYSDSITATVTF